MEPSSNQSYCFNLRDKIKLSTQTLSPFITTLESSREIATYLEANQWENHFKQSGHSHNKWRYNI